MAFTTSALHTEITTDPKNLGYAGKSDYDVSVLLNTTGLSGETIFKAYTALEDLVAGMVLSEYGALTGANLNFVNNAILGPGIRVKSGDANLRTLIGTIFGVGTTTRTNWTNAASKSATRAEVLFGEGYSVTDTQVAAAR